MMQVAQAWMRWGGEQGETQKLCGCARTASGLPGIPKPRKQQTRLSLITDQERLLMACASLPFIKA
jgi:hypothetical protein